MNEMKQHEFTLVLTTDPDEDDADRMYGKFRLAPSHDAVP